MKYCIAFLLMVLVSSLSAQKENYVWKMGNGLGINFNTCPPSQLYEGASTTWESSAAISDPVTGALLFYTNNAGVYNRNDQLMANGNLQISNSVTQIAIVPHPNKDSSHLYFIFSCQAQSGISGNQPLLCHVVDMRGNGGLGRVVIKNQFLLSGPLNEKVIAIRSADKKSFRVIVHGFMTNSFYTFKIDESGLDVNPVESAIGKVVNQTCMSNGANIGSLIASPDGKTLAYLNFCDKDFQLFKFDFTTGLLSDYLNIRNNRNPANPGNNPNSWGGFYGGSFSPDSKLLYISTAGGNTDPVCDLYQYDVSDWSSIMIENSVYTVKRLRDTTINSCKTLSCFRHLKLAPDGKIYTAVIYTRQCLPLSNPHDFDYCLPAITYPNVKGEGCAYDPCAIKFNPASQGKKYTAPNINGSYYENWCLNNLFETPILPPQPVQRLNGLSKVIPCQETELSPLSKPSEKVVKVLWSDNDTNRTRQRLKAKGTLWVDQETKCYIYRDSLFLVPPAHITGKKLQSCLPEKGLQLSFLSDTSQTLEFLWNDKDSSETSSIHVTSADTYLLRMTKNCEIITDTFVIKNRARKIGQKTDFCLGNGKLIHPLSDTAVAINYLWNNGRTEDSLFVDKPGIYWIDIITACDTIRDSFSLRAREFRKGFKQNNCPGDTLRPISKVTDPYELKWSNGSSGTEITKAAKGTYWVETISECLIIRDSIEVYSTFLNTPSISRDTSFCGRQILYHLDFDTSVYDIKWKNGTFGADIILNSKGEYPFTLISYDNCFWDSGRIRVLQRPNSPVYFENTFSPNQDGHNESFPSFNFNNIDLIESIEVYSRWGDLIFSGKASRWDGTFKGEPCPDGVYLCRIMFRNCDYTLSHFYGMVHLLR